MPAPVLNHGENAQRVKREHAGEQPLHGQHRFAGIRLIGRGDDDQGDRDENPEDKKKGDRNPHPRQYKSMWIDLPVDRAVLSYTK